MNILKEEIARKKREIALMAEKRKNQNTEESASKEDDGVAAKRSKFDPKTDFFISKQTQGQVDAKGRMAMDPRKVTLSRKEVIRRLREREEPIRLFGEDDSEAFFRLRRLEVLEPEINKGFKNDFLDAMDKVDEDYVKQLLASSSSSSSPSATDSGIKAGDVKMMEDCLQYEEIMSMKETLGQKGKAYDCQVILNFLKVILNSWGEELNTRPEDVKRSVKGKMESATHMQTVAYIRPLFRKLKNHTLSDAIFESLTEIAEFMIDRQYLKANESYLEMAIGNAPWPIGVTMVGIHARTGREKISAKNVAHVLNDEVQRKYIQALKRLMTRAQKYFPTDPSRCVNFHPTTCR